MERIIKATRSERGFSLMELIGVLVILIIVVVVIMMQVSGAFSGSRAASMDSDIHTVETALDQYVLKSMGKVPTVSGNLPADGEYAPLDFNAGFTIGTQTWYFHPDCVKRLPRHHDEGVWRVDHKGVVSVDMDSGEY